MITSKIKSPRIVPVPVTFPNSPFRLHRPFEPAGDQPEAIAKLVEGLNDGLAFQTLLGVTGSGKTYTMANVIAHDRPPGDHHGAEQDARRPALFRNARVLSRERHRVFRLLLRLLPAGSLRSVARPVHREGFEHQRTHRADAAVRDQVAARARRCGHRRHGLGDLRHRRSGRLSRHDPASAREARK